ncbi:MAG: MFS transporter, partial [Umezawaea sp.]
LALASALCTLRLRVPPQADTGHASLLGAMRDGVRHLVTTPPLRGATLATVLAHGSVGLLATALPVRVAELGHPEGAAGFVWAAIEVGSVVSLLVLRGHLHRWRPERVLYASIAAYGLVVGMWFLASEFLVLVGLAVVAGIAQGPTLTSLITARQRYTPPGLLGQVSTTGPSLKIGAFAIGAAVGGTLHNTRAAILAVAATHLLAAALGRLVSAARAAPSASRGGPPGCAPWSSCRSP